MKEDIPILHESKTQNFSSLRTGIVHDTLEDITNVPFCETLCSQSSVNPLECQERAIDVPEFMLNYAQTTIEEIKKSIIKSCDKPTARKTDTYCSNNLNSVDSFLTMARSSDCFTIPTTRKNPGMFALPSKHSIGIPASTSKNAPKRNENLMSYKLSPKVFGRMRPMSISFENLASTFNDSPSAVNTVNCKDEFSNWKSLHNVQHSINQNVLSSNDIMNSEPDLRVSLYF